MSDNLCFYLRVHKTSDFSLWPWLTLHDYAWLLLGHCRFVGLFLWRSHCSRGTWCRSWKHRVMSATGWDIPMHPLETLWLRPFNPRFLWNRWKRAVLCSAHLLSTGLRKSWFPCLCAEVGDVTMSCLSQQHTLQFLKSPSSETCSAKIMFYVAKWEERKMAFLIKILWLWLSLLGRQSVSPSVCPRGQTLSSKILFYLFLSL